MANKHEPERKDSLDWKKFVYVDGCVLLLLLLQRTYRTH